MFLGSWIPVWLYTEKYNTAHVIYTSPKIMKCKYIHVATVLLQLSRNKTTTEHWLFSIS